MNSKDFLDTVCNEIKYKPANKMISDELEGHIEDLKNDNLCKGYTDEQAEEKAVEQMGNAKKIGKKLNQIHKPKLDWMTLFLALVFIWFGGQFWSLFYPDSYWNYRGSSYWVIHYRLTYIELILGIIFSIFIYFYDYRKICKYSKLLYILATVLNIVAYFRGFRANGNLVYGLYPCTQTSPAVISIPLYIIAFAGFIKEINKESKINITISNGRKINYNIVEIIVLGCLALITSLMINFVSGFLVAMVYVIIFARELLKRKQIKNMFILIGSAIILFSLLSMIICIIPTRQAHSLDKYTSAYWVGVDTVGERRIDFVREEIFKAAKLSGQADLQGISQKDELGYMSSIQNYFEANGIFAFLGILSRYGWIASFCLIVILLLFNIKLIISTIKIKDEYGKLIMIGITSLYIVQTVCNLAMNLGIIGVAEFDLPFISGGNATFIVNMLSIALILSVYRRKDINFEEPKKSKLLTKIEDFLIEDVEEYKEGDEVTNAYK